MQRREMLFMTELTYLQKVAYIISYDAMIVDRVTRGWQPYFLNFMFRIMPRKLPVKKRIMTDEVQRAYSILTTNVVRKPKSPSWNAWLPFFLGCPDLPVAKNKKVSPWEPVINDGWHFNGCLILPPPDRCRIRGQLQLHFNELKKAYCPRDRKLHRIYAEPLATPMVADYTLKQYKRGNVAFDDILILPRSRSEIMSC
jgi:hypothetical protein